MGFPVPAWKKRAARWLAGWWGSAKLRSAYDPAWISHDPVVVKAYREDPLVFEHTTARTYVALERAMDQARLEAGLIRIPTLVLYGQEDRMASPMACQRFADALSCEKSVKVFPGAFHELHHEPIAAQAREDVLNWIRRQG